MKSVLELLKDIETEMHRTAEEASIDAVHDLRVSVRRATAALRFFAGRVPRAKRLRRDLKRIREKAATVRDRDVTRQLLRRHRLPAADPACVYLQGQRDLAAGQLQQFLQTQIRKERPSRWLRWIGAE